MSVETIADKEYRKAIFGTKKVLLNNKLIVPFAGEVKNRDVKLYGKQITAFLTRVTQVRYNFRVFDSNGLYVVDIKPIDFKEDIMPELSSVAYPIFDIRKYNWQNTKQEQNYQGILVSSSLPVNSGIMNGIERML